MQAVSRMEFTVKSAALPFRQAGVVLYPMRSAVSGYPAADQKERNKINIEKTERNGIVCAVVRSDEKVITDVQSALDLLMTASYEFGTKNIVIDKELITEDFFVLSTCLAGEILQKYVNYGGRIAIYGDFSHYTSKPLKDFMYESNKGHDVFFAAEETQAVKMLTR